MCFSSLNFYLHTVNAAEGGEAFRCSNCDVFFRCFPLCYEFCYFILLKMTSLKNCSLFDWCSDAENEDALAW